MTSRDVLAAIRLPPASVLERRVAKTDFAERLSTPADRRLVDERIEALVWHAALNPVNTNLPAGHTPGLAVVTLSIRDRAVRGPKQADADDPSQRPPPRLLALIHRIVPDPLLLLTLADGRATTLSVKPALGDILAAALPDALPPEAAASLAVDRAGSLGDLHDRWCAAILALNAWRVSGTFRIGPPGPPATAARQALLEWVIALDSDIRRLNAAARRETQHRRRAELNERLQHVRRQRQEAADQL